MSRDRILSALRAGLSHAAHTGVEHPVLQPEPLTPPSWPTPVDQLRARFEGLGGIWHQAGSGAAVAAVVAPLVPGGKAILVSRDPAGRLDAMDLARELTSSGLRVVRTVGETAAADEIGVTVTGVTVAIAESGTLALLGSPGQGRLSSLIAPIHVAIVGRLEVVPALADYLHLARTALAFGETSAGIMITGPSRTADIEGQLIVGVHGPREIHLVLMD